MRDLELSTSTCDGHVVVALSGEMDVTSAGEAEAAIAALTVRGQCLIIDLSALGFMDCASLGALLRVRKLARCGGGEMVLGAPQPQVRRLLALTGKDEASWVHPSVASAVAGLASRGNLSADGPLTVSTARPGRAVPSRPGTG